MTLLSPDQYMDLLQQRCEEHDEQVQAAREEKGMPPTYAWVRTLPEMMIRDGDEDLVDMDALNARLARLDAPAPKPAPKPRTYRSAASIRAELDSVTTRMEAIDGIRRHDTDDPAAYGGIGIRQTPRQRRRYEARIEKAVADYARLDRRRKQLQDKLARAERREQG